MHITLLDDSSEFDGYTPSSRPLGGAEKAFASLPGALVGCGHEVTVINRTRFEINVDGAAWRMWDMPHPTSTDVLIAFRQPALLDLIPAEHRILWLAGPAGYLARDDHAKTIARHQPTLVFMGEAHRRTWTPVDGVQAVVIPPGVRDEFLTSDFDDGPPPPAAAVITTHPRRGLDGLLHTWVNHIHPNCTDARLTVYSSALDRGQLGGDVDDALRPVFQRARDAAGHGVAIARPQADPGMADAYRAARVHLYPGEKADILCATLAESQACGLPAVARAGGAVAERVANGKTGYVVPDAEALANIAVLLLTDDAAYFSLSREARAAQRSRTWAQAAKEFEALWQ